MNRFAVLLLAVVLAAAAIVFLRSRDVPIVLDEAGLLDESERAFVSKYHGYLVKDHDIDYRVVTSNLPSSVLEQAVDLYEKLGVGSRSEWGRGLLLVINPETNRVRLEVGYALEGTFPDAFAAYVEQRQMVPFFADGRVADGILATTEFIVDRAQRAVERSGSVADEVWMMGSGGAGAQTEAQIGTGRDHAPEKGADSDIMPASSPSEALSAYLTAMDARNLNPRLPIYSPETQSMLQGRTLTEAQADMVVRTYRACSPQGVRYNDSGILAVIRYAPAERACAPWFFVKQGSHWTLDLASMSRTIRFGRTNAWHRSAEGFGEYSFAFEDWTFDRHGFPR